MKDIKSLYLAAKSSGKHADITAYTEAINDLIENDPASYITHLEYIILSDIGLRTVKPFIEKNGFPIACYDSMIECLNECIRKCEVYNKDASIYTEAIEYFESFRKDHINCFMMFESYKFESSLNTDTYIATYYNKNGNGVQNRKLAAGMINYFGEAAIPDALITAESINVDAINKVLEYIDNTYTTNENSATIYEWVLTCCEDIGYDTSSAVNHMNENCLSTLVDNIHNREHQVFRESLIMGNDDLVVEYSEDDINNIKDLITFKEYQMTWSNEIKESSIINLQNEIYSLYEMLDGVIEEDVADNIVPMLPGNKGSIDEATWVMNTRNKKTGEMPGYIAKNHDLNYGEEDPNKKSTSNSTDKEPSIDDYRRPSASNNNDEKPAESIPSAYDKDDEPTPSSSNTNTPNISEEDKRIINNYYYTYTNSLNRNTHSVNTDNSIKNNKMSTKDDHSTTTSIDSYNKNVNKDDQKDNEESNESNESDESTNESSKPWELNLFDNNEVFEEASEDPDKPKSDHPVKDILTDLDRATTKKQQEAKKKVQDIQNVAKAAVKPINRTKSWIDNMVNTWKDADENNIKEKMADPHSRKNLFSAINKAIAAGSLFKAGLLLNPVFLALSISKGISNNKREFRIRNEMIGELKTEIAIIDEKIKDADFNRDQAEKYKLMRFKNELNKKLIRVGGNKDIKKMI